MEHESQEAAAVRRTARPAGHHARTRDPRRQQARPRHARRLRLRGRRRDQPDRAGAQLRGARPPACRGARRAPGGARRGRDGAGPRAHQLGAARRRPVGGRGARRGARPDHGRSRHPSGRRGVPDRHGTARRHPRPQSRRPRRASRGPRARRPPGPGGHDRAGPRQHRRAGQSRGLASARPGGVRSARAGPSPTPAPRRAATSASSVVRELVLTGETEVVLGQGPEAVRLLLVPFGDAVTRTPGPQRPAPVATEIPRPAQPGGPLGPGRAPATSSSASDPVTP